METYKIYEKNNKVAIFNTSTFEWHRMSKIFFEDHKEEFVTGNKKVEKPESGIKIVYFAVTNKCNMSCKFCCTQSSPNVDTTGEMAYDDIEKVLIPFLLEIKPTDIILSGGEPLTRVDIIEICILIKKWLPDAKIALQTNGLLLTLDLLKELKGKVSYMEISIEDMFLDKKYYQKLSNLFDMIKQVDIPVQFSYVISGDNMKYITKAIDVVNKYDGSVLLRYVSPVGNATKSDIKFVYESNIKKLYLEIIDYIVDNKLDNPNVIDIILRPLQSTESCAAYGKMLNISPTGEMYLCSTLCFEPFILGNIKNITIDTFKYKLKKVLSNNEVKRTLRVEEMDICKECDIKHFCSGICAAKRYNTTDSEILYADCRMKRILVYFWLFDFDGKKSVYDNLLTLRGRIDEKYDLKK